MVAIKSPPHTSGRLGRRVFVLGGLTAVCAGCTRVDIPVIDDLQSFWQLATGSFPEAPLTRSDVSKLPYATMRAKIGRGSRGLLALGRYEGQKLFWYSKDRALFVTRGGRVLQTGGLPENLLGTRVKNADPVMTGLHRLTGPTDFVRWIDTDFENRYQMKVTSRFELVRREKIEILGREHNTIFGREKNYAPDIGWKFTNRYWVDEGTGFVWKSRQYIAKSFGPLEFEVLKPAKPLPTPA
jgi:hypothetical protein